MVEMIETANILRYATDRSLVVLDEVGRGTATFDGLSLAWAVVEYLERECGAKTLFATHYHELTELASMLTGVVNRTMLVKEWEDKIVFLRRVVPGQADKSYGIQVARLAGLPADVLTRARELLDNLESQEFDVRGRPRIARGDGAVGATGRHRSAQPVRAARRHGHLGPSRGRPRSALTARGAQPADLAASPSRGQLRLTQPESHRLDRSAPPGLKRPAPLPAVRTEYRRPPARRVAERAPAGSANRSRPSRPVAQASGSCRR